MKVYLFLIASLSFSTAFAAGNIEGSWKLKTVSCKSGVALSARSFAALQEGLSLNLKDGKAVLTTTYEKVCSLTLSGDYVISGNHIIYTNLVISFGAGCGQMTGKTQSAPNDSGTFKVSATSLTLEDPSTDGSTCPVGDVEIEVYEKI